MLAEDLQIRRGVTSVIGGGGKTTLVLRLARELAEGGARVVVATSTKMHVPTGMEVLVDPTLRRVDEGLAKGGPVCVCGIHGSGKAMAPALAGPSGPVAEGEVFEVLAGLADYVLVEADGSKGLPLKAHAPHEPVIPRGSTQTVCVVGADGFGVPIAKACHRPERYAELAGAQAGGPVTPAMAARVLKAEALHDRVLVNKCDTAGLLGLARDFAAQMDRPVVAGSLRTGVFLCLR